MASWRSSSDRSDRSTSPPSSTTPLSPSTFPLWLRPPKASKAVLPPGRYKVLAAALSCVLLGWLMTSALSPDASELDRDDTPSAGIGIQGILGDPTGYSGPSSDPYDPSDEAATRKEKEGSGNTKTPTIKGALGELHKAVSDKLYGLTSYGLSEAGKITNSSLATSKLNSSTSYQTGEQIKDGLSEDEKLGARTRIGKCTILFNGNSYYERAIRSHELHDKIHGYRLHVLRQQLLDDVWSKPAYVLSLLLRELAKPESERLEWLFWVDADTIILNPYIPIDTFLPPAGSDFEHIHFLYSNDWNGLNNGVFPIRVNKWSVELLSAIVAYRYYRPDGDLTFRDQSAMNTLMREPKFAKNVMELPQRWFNAYQGEHNETLAPYMIRRGDFLVHFAGVIDREPRMTYWLDRAESHLDDWEVPYKSTSYPQEVKDFWAEQRRLRQEKHNGMSEARLSATNTVSKSEQMLSDYPDHLSEEQIESVKKAIEKLKSALSNEEYAEDLDGLNGVKVELEAVSVPLRQAMEDSHRSLLTSAHEVIFAGEKDLMDNGFYRGITNPEITQIDQSVKHLKQLVLSTEDQWDRNAIVAAMDAVTENRGHLQQAVATVEAAQAAERKAQEEERIKAQQAAEAQRQAASAQTSTGNGPAPSSTETEAFQTDFVEGQAKDPRLDS